SPTTDRRWRPSSPAGTRARSAEPRCERPLRAPSDPSFGGMAGERKRAGEAFVGGQLRHAGGLLSQSGRSFPLQTSQSGRETEGEGFEPSSEEDPLKRFSRPPHSTALPPLQGNA